MIDRTYIRVYWPTMTLKWGVEKVREYGPDDGHLSMARVEFYGERSSRRDALQLRDDVVESQTT